MQIKLVSTIMSLLLINTVSSQAITYSTIIKHSLCSGYNNGSAEITITPTNPPYTFLWSNGDTDNYASDLSPGDYTVTITDNLSNTETVTVTIEELPCDFTADFYFSPNGDGINDTWFITNTIDFPELLVIVYNRMGQKVFESKGQYQGWDGRDLLGALLPDATYFYIIYAHKKNKKPAEKGSVSILK